MALTIDQLGKVRAVIRHLADLTTEEIAEVARELCDHNGDGESFRALVNLAEISDAVRAEAKS